MKKYRIIFLIFVGIIVASDLQAGYFDRASAMAYNWLGKTPLYAGYQYTEEQKEDAREAIKDLEQEQLNIIYSDFADEGYGTIAKRHRRVLSEDDNTRLKEIKEELYELKLITGDAWSTRRRVVLGTLALAGFAALGYNYLVPDEITRLKNEFELLGRDLLIQEKNGASIEQIQPILNKLGIVMEKLDKKMRKKEFIQYVYATGQSLSDRYMPENK